MDNFNIAYNTRIQEEELKTIAAINVNRQINTAFGHVKPPSYYDMLIAAVKLESALARNVFSNEKETEMAQKILKMLKARDYEVGNLGLLYYDELMNDRWL